ncbi:unnamed protein product [Auanema sp. JU1783]|nr:unnamed protein product [Auanema sp. JU1783]
MNREITAQQMTSKSFLAFNKPELEKKFSDFYETLKNKGTEIVCDFDQTLSSDSSLITHQSFPETTKIRLTGELLSTKQNEMNNRFAVIHNTTPPEKMNELYEEWWSESHELIKASDFHETQLKRCAERITFRDGAIEFIKFCEVNNLTLIIFSAGIANIIRESLTLILGCNNPQNVFVIANEMNFQLDGSVDSFSPTIHSLNKSYEYFAPELDVRIGTPSLCLVIGDSRSDADMMKGFHRPVLKIGIYEGKEFFDAFLEEKSFTGLTLWLQQLRTDKL